MPVNPLTIDPSQWVSILEGAVHSRQKIFGHHFYIIQEEGVLKADTLKKGGMQERLSINNIVDISKTQFGSLRDRFARGDINLQQFDSLSRKIAPLTEQLIDSRIAKRNHPLKVIGRQIAYAISAFASIFGISAFKSLKESDKAFQNEVIACKRGLAEAKQTAENLVMLENRRTKIDQLNQEIPGIIAQTLAAAPREEVAKLLEKKIREDIKETVLLQDRPCTLQFQKDIERNFQFKRKDAYQNMNDQNFYPNIQPSENDNIHNILIQRVDAGIIGIKALIIKEEDKRWEKIIQSACTQSTLNALFDTPLLLFGLMSYNLHWEEKGGIGIARLKFPGLYPPIQIEIIRDPDNQTIQKANIFIEGSVHLLRELRTHEIETSIEKTDAMKGKLHYSITLDENEAPVIEITHYELSQ